MANVQYHVALSFHPAEANELICGKALPAASPAQARDLARWLAQQHGGAVAFTRRGDPDRGIYKDAQILDVFGTVPPDIVEQVRRQEK